MVDDPYALWAMYRDRLIHIRGCIREHWGRMNGRGKRLLARAERATMEDLDRLEGIVS